MDFTHYIISFSFKGVMFIMKTLSVDFNFYSLMSRVTDLKEGAISLVITNFALFLTLLVFLSI